MRKFVNFLHHYGGTAKHKLWVLWYMVNFSVRLIWRAIIHDLSKFSRKESEGFIQTIDKLKTSTYGSPEYKELLQSIDPSIKHHYKINTHHPEHYKAGVSGMDLVDIVEMLCDWKAATRRHINGNIARSIEQNRKRFDYTDQLCSIFHHTAARFLWLS